MFSERFSASYLCHAGADWACGKYGCDLYSLKMPIPIACYMHKPTRPDVWCLDSNLGLCGQSQWSFFLSLTNWCRTNKTWAFSGKLCNVNKMDKANINWESARCLKHWLVLRPFIYNFRLSYTICINLYAVQTWVHWVASPASLDPCLV